MLPKGVVRSLTEERLVEKRERREIYDNIMEKAERILSAMKESGQAIRESAWRIAVESWLKSNIYIKPHIKRKVAPNSSPFFIHE